MGDKLDVGLQFGMVVEGRQKSPPVLGEILIAHVEGGSAAHYSSMTSSSIGAKPVEEGRDEEPVVAFCFECDWTMNSWVFRQYRSCLQSQSIMISVAELSSPGRLPVPMRRHTHRLEGWVGLIRLAVWRTH